MTAPDSPAAVTPFEMGIAAGHRDYHAGNETPNPFADSSIESAEWQKGHDYGWGDADNIEYGSDL